MGADVIDPHMRNSNNGLLECTNEDCVAECNGRSKKWNRDLLAVLNFRRIWDAYMGGNDRPERFTSEAGYTRVTRNTTVRKYGN
jgi:hypothetical protein